MNEQEMKDWLFIYLSISKNTQSTAELQYQLFFELYAILNGAQSKEERCDFQKEFDEKLNNMAEEFKKILPRDICERILDWKAFAVGYITKETWKIMKDYYEEKYNEKYDIERAGMH